MTVYMRVVICLLLASLPVHAKRGEVIHSFPAPGGTPTGLAWDGSHLWIADIGSHTIYQMDAANGAIIRSLHVPEGVVVRALAWDGSALWYSDGANNRLIRLDVESGSELATIEPGFNAPEGLTVAGSVMWCQEPKHQQLFKLDWQSGTVLDTLRTIGGYRDNLGLAWDGTYLWSTDVQMDALCMIDVNREAIVGILPAPGDYPYGLVYDGEALWTVDYRTDMIYQVSIRGSEKYQISDPLPVTIRYTGGIKNIGSSTMQMMTFFACPPQTVYQQLDEEVKYDTQPDTFIVDAYGQRIACFDWQALAPGEERIYQWQVPVTLYNIRYFLHPDSVGTLADIPDSIIARYTTDGDKYRIHDDRITAAVREAVGDETNLYWQVRKIHDYVVAHVDYVNDKAWDRAPDVLSQGTGSCSEYTFLFIAMCRALGIPARYEAGGHLRSSIPYEDTVFHRWHQVYFPHYGWVPVDCTWDDKPTPIQQAWYFGAMSNQAFTTTIGGGGEYGLWWYYNFAYRTVGGERERFRVMEWLPYTTSVSMVQAPLPVDQRVCQNFPNPFNGSTVIRYYVPEPMYIRLAIFDVMGRSVFRTERYTGTGWDDWHWNGTNMNGLPVSSGVYYYRIQGALLNLVGKMTLIK